MRISSTAFVWGTFLSVAVATVVATVVFRKITGRKHMIPMKDRWLNAKLIIFIIAPITALPLILYLDVPIYKKGGIIILGALAVAVYALVLPLMGASVDKMKARSED